MEFLKSCIDIFLHLDKHLTEITTAYGTWTYAILFLVVFCETGLVVTPFLPGDSLLFAAGAIAAVGGMDPFVLSVILIVAAILGDSVNYRIGRFIGPKIFSEEKPRFIKRDHLIRTQEFYERHGGKTIIIARFVPIIRTFAPFVAGVAKMNYGTFILYNVIGGVVWVLLFVWAGYLFSGIPLVKNNFSIVILAIIVISVLPAVFEIVKARSVGKKAV